MVAVAGSLAQASDRHGRVVDGLQALYVERASRHGVKDAAQVIPALLGMDIELNAQGLAVWLDRQAPREATAG